MRIKKANIIAVQDWDELIVKTYNRPYNFQQQDGCQNRGIFEITIPNDDIHDFEGCETVPEKCNHSERGVSFEAWLKRDPKQELNAEDWKSPSAIELWWDRNFYPDIQMVANDLYAKGLIEAGTYIINIDW